MDIETVRFMRRLFGVLCALIGAAAGYQYYAMLGGVGGAFVGYAVGWNLVDLFKGRARK